MRKQVLYSIQSPYREPMDVIGFKFGSGKKTMCVVGAMRGNEIQQMYVCSQLVNRLKALEREGAIADGLFKEIQGYTYGVQMASFYQQGDFLPHVKIMETGFTEHGFMNDFGLSYAFVRTPRPYDTTTLNYNWQIWGTKAFSLYTNATDAIDERSAKIAVDAILRFMAKHKIISAKIVNGYNTEIISENRLMQIHSSAAGIYKSYVKTGDEFKSGDLLCDITDPLEGNVISQIYAPVNGIVFFRYNRPLEFEKTVLYKIIRT